jgi:hypothetical protein
LKERDFLERLKDQGYQALPIGIANETNGLQFEEFILDIPAAKSLLLCVPAVPKTEARAVSQSGNFSIRLLRLSGGNFFSTRFFHQRRLATVTLP